MRAPGSMVIIMSEGQPAITGGVVSGKEAISDGK